MTCFYSSVVNILYIIKPSFQLYSIIVNVIVSTSGKKASVEISDVRSEIIIRLQNNIAS